MAFLKDLEPERGQFERIDRAISSLRDEVAAYNFQRSHGQNRLLSLVVAKLDEAAGLALLAGIDTGRFVVIDRKEMLRPVTTGENIDMGTDTTVTADENGRVNV